MLLCNNPQVVKIKGRHRSVGCGKCPECLRKRRNEWVQRLVAEWRYTRCTKFVTLTYDDAHLPIEEVEEGRYRFVFRKRDVQLFFKRFRKIYKVRYFLVSEFGDSTQRPHYHALLFFDNFFSDKEVEFMIQSTWDCGWIIDVSDLRGVAGIRYVCDYMYKQQDDEKTFILSSRKPGIGYKYVDRFKDYHHNKLLSEDENFDSFVLNRMSSDFDLPMCRYFRDKIFPPKTSIHELSSHVIEERGLQFRRDLIKEYMDKNNSSFEDFLIHERHEAFVQCNKLKNKIK